MRTIQQLWITLLALTCGVVFTSCSDDDNKGTDPNNPSGAPIEDFSQGNMNFTEAAGEQTFTFTANVPWTIRVAETSGGDTWCSVSPSSGDAGYQTITVSASVNESYDDRSVTVTLQADTATESFVVTQKQKNALLLTSDKFEVAPEGGVITVEVKANVDYTATISETCKDWITEAPGTKVLTTTTKSYQISPNEDGEKREGSIVFTDGTLTETVHIYQAEGNVILLTKNEYYADADGEDITVELRSNCEYEVVMPSVDWVHEVTTRAMSSHTLHYTVDANSTYDAREVVIIYRDKENSTADTLTIIQAQKDAIVLSAKEYEVSPAGETIEVKLASNVEYSIAISSQAQSWISEVDDAATKALVDHTYYFRIAPNESDKVRTGYINFSNGQGTSDQVTVTQREPILEITSEKKLDIEAGSQNIEVTVNVNVDFTVEIPVDWITQGETRKDGEVQTLVLAVSENTGNEIREAEITLRNTEFSLSETMSIVQRGKMIEVTVKTAGTLRTLLESSYNEETLSHLSSLKINGPLNGTDFYYINNSFTLKHLDMSGASIVSGGNYYYYNNYKYYTVDNEIGSYMFIKSREDFNKSYETIILPKNVVSIGENAFRGCRSLLSVTLSESLTTIGDNAFSGCSGLISITIPDGLTSIGDNAFRDCSGLTFITIPDGVTSIGDNAFRDCSGLTSITIPDGLTSIGQEAFSGCSGLTSVTLPDGLTSIGGWAFYGCSGLTSITIQDGVTSIGSCAFEGCSGLTSVTLPDGLTSIGDNAFRDCSGLTFITIPDGLTSIGDNAFRDCSGLTFITIPDGVTSIGDNAFRDCSGLTSITIPDGLTSIGQEAFSGCSGLTSVTLPDGLTSIEKWAFDGCSGLTSIVLPASLTSIGGSAFSGVPLKECRIYATIPPRGGTGGFSNPNYAESTLYVPKGCVAVYEEAGWGQSFYNIVEMD